MENKFDYKRIWKTALWISGMVIFLTFTVLWYRVIEKNNDIQTTDGKETESTVRFNIKDMGETTDSWTTALRLSEDPDDVEEFTGETISAVVINDNNYDIKDWELHIEITDECYLSGFWCGSVIVNQHRGEYEQSYLIDSQASDITGQNIDRNIYTDVMMIHLMPGDELVYLPSKNEKEDLVKSHGTVGIGFIFYFKDSIDLSSWKLSYLNNIKLTNLFLYKIELVVIFIWVAALIFYHSMVIMEKKMKKQMNSRIKNISVMSDIYMEAYIVDIDKNTARLIKGDVDNLVAKLEGVNVQEAIYDVIRNKCQPAYREEMLNFFNLSTIVERMSGVTSITTEFVGTTIGWCAVRVFKDEENSNNIVITLQDINEEKKKLRLIEERINIAEYKQNVSGSFLGTVSFALNDISKKIGNDAGEIMAASNQEEVKSLADRVICNTRHMNLIQNTMLDLYKIESQNLELNIHRYSIKAMLDELYHILSVYAEGKAYDFSFDVDKSIPEYLTGDADRIEQILIIILFSSMLMTQEGYVSFSLYGKKIDNEEELIFSIRDSAGGFSSEQINEIYEFINGSSIETFDNASLVYLKIINGILNSMNSELKIVSVLNEGSDFYFTLRQGIPED